MRVIQKTFALEGINSKFQEKRSRFFSGVNWQGEASDISFPKDPSGVTQKVSMDSGKKKCHTVEKSNRRWSYQSEAVSKFVIIDVHSFEVS